MNKKRKEDEEMETNLHSAHRARAREREKTHDFSYFGEKYKHINAEICLLRM